MTEQRQRRKPGTKTVFETYESTRKELSQEEYNNVTDKRTMQWFRRLGGAETAQRSYTNAGYIITRMISRSPDREIKVIRDFSVKGA
jgi:hypothetical protein